MTFVTRKREGYCLFTTTPSGRAAVGLTNDQNRVDLFILREAGWETVRSWPVDQVSHTDVLLRLGSIDEPSDPLELLPHLPAATLDS